MNGKRFYFSLAWRENHQWNQEHGTFWNVPEHRIIMIIMRKIWESREETISSWEIVWTYSFEMTMNWIMKSHSTPPPWFFMNNETRMANLSERNRFTFKLPAFTRCNHFNFFFNLLSYFFVKKIPLRRRVGYVMGWWFCESVGDVCMSHQSNWIYY